MEGIISRWSVRADLRSPLFLAAAGSVVLAIAVRVPYLGMGVVAPDTVDYLARGHAVLEGNGFPDALRTPVVPLIFAGFEAVGTEPVVSLVVLQNLFGILMPAAVVYVGWRYFTPAAGVVSGCLAAASPLLVLTEQFALTDYFFGVAIFVATVLLAEAAWRVHAGHSARAWLIAAGAMCGVATLIRGNGQYAIAAIPIALLLSVGDWRRALRASAVALVSMVLVLSPWVIHNVVRYGTPQVTTLGGIAIYVRVIDHDRMPPPTGSKYGPLARTTYDDEYAFAPSDVQLTSGLSFIGVLANKGIDNVEISSIMAGIALEAIRANPSSYLSNTWDILREYQGLYDPRHESGEDDIELATSGLVSPASEATLRGRHAVPGESAITRVPWKLAQALSRILYLLSFAGVLALVLPFIGSRKARISSTVFLTVLLLGFAVGAASSHFEPRYDISYAFLAWLLLGASASWLLRSGARVALVFASRFLAADVVERLRFPDAEAQQARQSR